MLSKIKFLQILDKILLNKNLIEKEKGRLVAIKQNCNELPEEISSDLLIEKLDLITIKGVTDEDGYFKEFVNTTDNMERESQTEIFYLLKGKQVSCLHALETTETWNWLGGKEISIFKFKNQELEEITLNETNLSHTIEKDILFGAKLTNSIEENDFAIVTCLCKPGFVPKYYKNPSPEELSNLFKTYPNYEEIINELTPKTSNTKKNIWQSIFQFFTCCIGIKKNEDEQIDPLINSIQNNP